MDVKGEVTYTRIHQIGQGQGKNSTVWKAHDQHLGRDLAIKEIPKQLLQGQQLADFFQEAKVMFASSHPQNVVPILYACDCHSQQSIAIAMPLYTQGSLHDRIAAGPLQVSEAIRVTLKCLNGLHKIHGAGFIHFDIKPSNILFSDFNDPMVADFGQTRAVSQSGTASLPPLYPHGVPPEFFTPGAIGTRATDVYHTGLLLYRIVNGDPFFNPQRPNATDLAQMTISGRFPRRDLFFPHVPKRLRTVIRKCLEVLPQNRYHSVSELETALSGVEIKRDWEVSVFPNGDTEWVCRRKKSPDLAIRLRERGSAWCVEGFSAQAGKSERAWQKKQWLAGATRDAALVHLKNWFHSLE